LRNAEWKASSSEGEDAAGEAVGFEVIVEAALGLFCATVYQEVEAIGCRGRGTLGIRR
jgi:hypothetical protein